METILVPLSRPEQASILSTFILPVARGEHARVILLHICPAIYGQEGDSCEAEADEDSVWLQEAARTFKDAGVSVTIARREAQSIAGGIRDAVQSFNPDLLALSWRRPGPGEPDDDLALHDLLMDVPCDLVVWRGSQAAPPPHRVLIPSAGGPNVELGFRFAEDFHRAYGSKLVLLTVLPENASNEAEAEARKALEERTQEALAGLSIPSSAVELTVLRAKSPEAGILQMATPLHADVVIIGDSREGVIHRIRFGEIPEKVAARAQVPVLVIKRPLPRRVTFYRRAWDALAQVTPNLTEGEKVEVYRESRRNARSSRDFFTMIALSTAIATFGLMLNAPAVIIGAMLIAPLMNAIIAMGLGIVLGDGKLLSLGAKTTLAGILTTLLVSFFLELIIPFNILTPEMLARSSPNLLDLGVALAAGAAGAYALARKKVSSSLPGVAIAVALIPPLATTGMALALREWSVSLGAGLLFLTNLVGIVAMSSWVFLSMDFKPEVDRRERMRLFARGWQAVLVMILLITIPLAVVTVRQIKEQRISGAIQTALDAEFANMEGVQLRDWHYEIDGDTLNLELELETAQDIPFYQSIAIQERLTERLGRPVALTLKIIPTIRLDPRQPPDEFPAHLPAARPSPTP
jgi:uncharacterized hydrophobic protein (TIGR00271 family)